MDVTTQAEVMAILDGLRHESGLAMLLITHDLELAAACDRTAVMYAGQIVEVRASSLLHSDPLHPYTAALAAARPDITQTTRRLRAIPGRPLSAFEAPAAECAFAPRCPHAADVCRAAGPGLVEMDGGVSRCARTASFRPAPGGARWRGRRAPVLEVAGLRKQFGQFVAVDDVSLGLRRGRSLAIVGESGAGKTTIARMIIGLERPTSGAITACGHDRSRPPRSTSDRRRRGREVQIVFQDPYTSLDPRQDAEAAIEEMLGCTTAGLPNAAAPESPNSPAWSAWTHGSHGAARNPIGRPAAAGLDRPRPRGGARRPDPR